MPGPHRETYLVLLGPPGAGKGTLSRRLEQEAGWIPVSTGEEIRKRMALPGDDIGEASRPYMDRGDYIPDELALKLFFSITESLPDGARVALDGFPRTVHQAEVLEQWMEQEGHTFAGCIFLNLDPEVAAGRMRLRRVCPRCRKTFPAVAGDPAGDCCDECGERPIPREDDDPERMANRVRTHEQMTRPLREWFRERGTLVELDASKTTDELAEVILNYG
jgi:adenylate kinase